MTEADRLREYVSEISAMRHQCVLREMRAKKKGDTDAAGEWSDLEEHLVMLEDKLATSADRLDPPPTRYTGQQWIAVLSVPVGRVGK